jgi:hypothetical protein
MITPEFVEKFTEAVNRVDAMEPYRRALVIQRLDRWCYQQLCPKEITPDGCVIVRPVQWQKTRQKRPRSR